MVWPPPTVLAPGSEGSPDPAASQSPVAPPSQRPLPNNWLLDPQGLVGHVLDSKYRITEPLGRGPLTLTFRGESLGNGDAVILKLLPRRSEQTAEQFLWQVRETVSMARLEHPRVQSIVDFGSTGVGDAWLVRNSTSGLPLRALFLQGRVSERRSLSIACQVAEALAAAHRQEVVHGRLKPENILIDDSLPEQPGVTVVDFGLSQLGRGTAQTANEAPRPSDDVYSLGVLLFEMLAGQPPFAFEASELEGPERQLPKLFAHWAPPVEVSPATEQLVRRLLTPDAPGCRFTAQQLHDGLAALLTTCPASPSRRAAPRLVSDDEQVTRMVPASEPPPGGRLPYSRPPEVAAFARPRFDAGPARTSVLPPAPNPQGFAHSSASLAPDGLSSFPPPKTTGSFPPPAISVSPVALGLDLNVPEPEPKPRTFLAKLKRLFRRSQRPPGF